MGELSLRLTDGTVLIVPASLDAATTYVILEQERWFEKEAAFLLRWLRAGMTAIDIGANLGVYSLPMARLLAPGGQVFSYEPSSETRRLLERNRALNQATNLHVMAAALSERPGEARLVFGASSEMNRLGIGGPGERVTVTCLDVEDAARRWAAIDFVKIDAEGEEERIVVGGKSFFERHSPLVMFEIKPGEAIQDGLRSAFASHGYRFYRALAGAPVLVPHDPEKSVDGFELNLFAAKQDRAAALAREGLLVEAVPIWAPDAIARQRALAILCAQTFAPSLPGLLADTRALDADYRDGLAGYATWRSPEIGLTERYAALAFAFGKLLHICERAATLPRLSTLARVAWEAGERVVCMNALATFVELVKGGENRVPEPFWPACPRFDSLAPGAEWATWFVVAAFEQCERAWSHSSLFHSSGIDLDWLGSQPFVSAEIDRRKVLQRARAGDRVAVPARLRVTAADHINAEIWRAGLVPNTWIGDPTRIG
jgi:FkbM family methyltransferase